MRLPSHVLAKLTLAGLAIHAACEKTHEEPHCKSEPIVVEKDTRPMAGPKLVQPQPQPQPTKPEPQPIAKKPQKRMVWASVCGHSELVDEKAMLVKCGKG